MEKFYLEKVYLVGLKEKVTFVQGKSFSEAILPVASFEEIEIAVKLNSKTAVDNVIRELCEPFAKEFVNPFELGEFDKKIQKSVNEVIFKMVLELGVKIQHEVQYWYEQLPENETINEKELDLQFALHELVRLAKISESKHTAKVLKRMLSNSNFAYKAKKTFKSFK